MELLSLQLRVTDADLLAIAQKHVDDSPVEDLTVHIRPEGIRIAGYYPMFIRVRFETLWRLGAEQGKIHAYLDQASALGMPVSIFRSAVMKLIEDQIGKAPWLRIVSDRIEIDPEILLETELCPGRVNLREIRLEEGAMVVSAGSLQ